MDTSPADEIRAAAQKLRALTNAASTGRKAEPTARWAFTERCFDSGEGWGSGMLRAVDGLDADADPRLGKPLIHGQSSSHGRAPSLAVQHGAYIAAMDPAVGAALADWLDAEAVRIASATHPEWQETVAPHTLRIARLINL